jgi:hypothetical protein
MKSLKLIALIVILTLSVFCGIWSTSCSKDGCKGVTCLNYGTCAGGICQCDTGLGGPTCEIVYRNLYANTYIGNGTDDSGHQYFSNTLAFTTGTDTSNFNTMQLTWTNPGGITVDFGQIMLSNNLASGSNFTVTQTSVITVISGTVDTFTFSGGGSVNGNVASISLTEMRPSAPPIMITLNNLNVQ